MMNRLNWMTRGGLSFAGAALCCLTASAVRVETAYDHRDGLYYANQPVIFTVSVKDDAGAKLTNGVVTAMLDDYGTNVVCSAQDFDLAAAIGMMPYVNAVRWPDEK